MIINYSLLLKLLNSSKESILSTKSFFESEF